MNPAVQKLLNCSPEERRSILQGFKPQELAIIYKELEIIESTPRRHWYCPREACDGNPHAGFHWCEHPIDGKHTPFCKHARTAQRPPEEDPDNPWLVWFFSGGRGVGKALALDTPIPTPSGWAKMGELKVGDVVFDERGRVCNVTAVFDTMPERAYRLTFSDGSEIVACDEHQWVTLSATDGKSGTRAGFQIPENWAARSPVSTDEIVRFDRQHFIPSTLASEIPEWMLPEWVPNVREVVSSKAAPIQPMRCITVDSPNSMYLAGEAMIPTHNTRSGAEWVLDLVWNQGYRRIALIGRTPADVRDVMIYGDSGLMSVSDPHPRPVHEPTKRRLIWPNGAQAFTYSAAAPSQLRGPQHDAAWGDEIAAWTDAKKGDTLDTSYNNLMLGLRLGVNPKALFTSTPKRVRLVREIMDRKTTVITNGTTYENLDNLAPSFRENVLRAYENTRIGQQELMGVMLTDVEGALWTQEMIEQNRGVYKTFGRDND